MRIKIVRWNGSFSEIQYFSLPKAMPYMRKTCLWIVSACPVGWHSPHVL